MRLVGAPCAYGSQPGGGDLMVFSPAGPTGIGLVTWWCAAITLSRNAFARHCG